MENEQRAFHNCQFPQETLFDDMGETKLIEDLVGYLPTEEKEFSKDSFNNGEKIVSQKPMPPGNFKNNHIFIDKNSIKIKFPKQFMILT